jgi:hypothetical protein
MIAPAPAPSKQTIGFGLHTTFDSFLDSVLVRLPELHLTPDYALQSGVCVYALVQYAAGVCKTEDRSWVEGWLTALPWTMRTVVALVKGGRIEGSVESCLLNQARNNNLPDNEDVLLNQLIELHPNSEG